MAKVVSEINRGLASSRPQGAAGASQTRTNSDPTTVCVSDQYEPLVMSRRFHRAPRVISHPESVVRDSSICPPPFMCDVEYPITGRLKEKGTEAFDSSVEGYLSKSGDMAAQTGIRRRLSGCDGAVKLETAGMVAGWSGPDTILFLCEFQDEWWANF
ncbi:unnamed protein product [Pleuronectes platessa]|uniref:Uncharacterized protein n=1 Tax=Pleuronectes platessa TaxID=8262 RepID=A0A9N7VLF8_PLEPL|nr:unnamed protein product [Pleuronectes platessa]